MLTTNYLSHPLSYEICRDIQYPTHAAAIDPAPVMQMMDQTKLAPSVMSSHDILKLYNPLKNGYFCLSPSSVDARRISGPRVQMNLHASCSSGVSTLPGLSYCDSLQACIVPADYDVYRSQLINHRHVSRLMRIDYNASL